MELEQLAGVTGSASAQAGARPLPRARVAAHGLDNRGMEAAAAPGATSGRFGRMFWQMGADLPEPCLAAIAEAMIKQDAGVPIDCPEPVDENPTVPAGYTYYGQFVDHDISLDTTALNARNIDVAATTDFRTPALDLDCIYGRGPDDQPYLYDSDGLTLRLGAKLDAAGAGQVRSARDVLRLDDPNAQPSPKGKGPSPAILGDKRNDENRIVVQIQSTFISFHNKVVQDQALIEDFGGVWEDPGSRFKTAVNIVRWHHQWLVVNDFLGRVLDPAVLPKILKPGEPPRLSLYDHPAAPAWAYMPVEFAGAAYRFGHSMVRPGYALNGKVGADVDKETTGDETTSPQPEHRKPLFSDDAPDENLNGFGFPLPASWGIDWSFFLEGLPREGLPTGFLLPQHSYRIDATLVDPLAILPEFASVTGLAAQGGLIRNLAFRNLVRGTANLRLPSGEQVALALGEDVLPPEVLWSAGSHKLYDRSASGRWTRKPQAEVDQILGANAGDAKAPNDQRRKVLDAWVEGGDKVLKGNTPLWYYLLREAEFWGLGQEEASGATALGGQHLGPLGSRIVAETFVGLLWRDANSYLRRHPKFKPHATVSGGADHFKLAHLFKYALS